MSNPSRDQIDAILAQAVRAPSSHNTQPWIFEVDGRRIVLHADRTRALPVNDPDDRELTISCGCALMNLRAAAAAEGFAVVVDVLPDRGDPDLLAVATLDPDSEPQEDDAHLAAAIAARRTYRKAFADTPVSQDTISALASEAKREGAWFEAIEGGVVRAHVADLIAEGDAMQWANPSWRRELAAWMHPRRKGDGLTLPWLVAPVAQLIVRSFDMGNGVAAKDSDLSEASPLLALIGTDDDTEGAWLKAGQALERILLAACGMGLQASYLNQPIQMPVLRPKLQGLARCHGMPQILFRMGTPADDIPAAPRRALSDVTEVPAAPR
ncbi:MAG: hypothetical protein WCD16_02870 [Paracoccaceae bacterium]